jgi:predicted NUDIX family NTP pyrophosphohydrolase
MAQKKRASGILLIRIKNNNPEFFLVHLGGPYWEHKDLGAWSFPKGELDRGEDDLDAAMREWKEETNLPIPDGHYTSLGIYSNKSKEVHCYAVMGDAICGPINASPFTIEWPPKSGEMQTFYETDRSEWFDAETAKQKLHSYLSGSIADAILKFNL